MTAQGEDGAVADDAVARDTVVEGWRSGEGTLWWVVEVCDGVVN